MLALEQSRLRCSGRMPRHSSSKGLLPPRSSSIAGDSIGRSSNRHDRSMQGSRTDRGGRAVRDDGNGVGRRLGRVAGGRVGRALSYQRGTREGAEAVAGRECGREVVDPVAIEDVPAVDPVDGGGDGRGQ